MSERVAMKLPQLGDGTDEAVIVEWLIGVGESVEKGDEIVIIETDKATSELEAPVAGTVAAVHVDDGEEVEVGTVIAEFDPA